MLALKRIVTVAVMIYLLLALLFILVPAVRTTVMSTGSGLSVLDQERQFFYTMFVIGAVILALHLITENLDSVMLRRAVSQNEGKINELKAKLYDSQQRTGAPVPSGSRTVDGRIIEPAIPASRPVDDRSATPVFPQNDPSLTNTPPANRPPLA